MTTTDTIIPIGRDQFRQAVRRNIRSLLAMTETEQQDLAPAIGLSVSQLSERMTCSAAWRDGELLNVAHAFHTIHEAVVAIDADRFRQAITDAPPSTPRIHGPSNDLDGTRFGLAS